MSAATQAELLGVRNQSRIDPAVSRELRRRAREAVEGLIAQSQALGGAPVVASAAVPIEAIERALHSLRPAEIETETATEYRGEALLQTTPTGGSVRVVGGWCVIVPKIKGSERRGLAAEEPLR